MAEISVVGDDEAIRSLLEVPLQPLGHVVIKATDGRLWLEKWKAFHMDMINPDIFISKWDGFEFLLRFFHHPPLGVDPKVISIIVMTVGQWMMNSTGALRIARKHTWASRVAVILGGVSWRTIFSTPTP